MNINQGSLEILLDKKRYGGILLHISSLPSKYGIGDLGPNSFRFIDFLYKHKLKIWEILPFGPPSSENSPYKCFSTFAGNPLLISPEKLIKINLLTEQEVYTNNSFSREKVNFNKVTDYKWTLLKKAYKNFEKRNQEEIQQEFIEFQKENNYWLEDYSLFMSIKEANDMKHWNQWEEPLKNRNEDELNKFLQNHHSEISFYKFVQFVFFKQWNEVQKYAHKKGIKILGDIPIFMAYDSVDVWTHPEYFYLDEDKELIYVAGVPPDYFSDKGQLWGDPLYRWDILKDDGYKWWIERIKHILKLVDLIRIDHFRGFHSFWRIPAEDKLINNGEWIKGPGYDLFSILKKELGELSIIAEDLGESSKGVAKLLKRTGFPGMRVLQFAFKENKEGLELNSYYLPHNFIPNSVVYTGTHDNNTTKGWLLSTKSNQIQNYLKKYFSSSSEEPLDLLIRMAWSSVSKISIIPMQDLLGLGEDARMNRPGIHEGNWEWRFQWEQLNKERNHKILELNSIYERDV
jgi:4-alpha-glucanotransferase